MAFFRFLYHVLIILSALAVMISGGLLAFFGVTAGLAVYASTATLGAIQNAFTSLWMTPVGFLLGALGFVMLIDVTGDAWEALKRTWRWI